MKKCLFILLVLFLISNISAQDMDNLMNFQQGRSGNG